MITGTAKAGISSIKNFGIAFSSSSPPLEPTYETDFSSSTGWDKTGTSQEISSGALNYDSVPNNSNQSISHTLTSAASDTAYVLRYKDTIDGFTQNSGQEQFIFMGLSSADDSTSGGSNQDYLMLTYQIDGGKDNIANMDCDNQSPSTQGQTSEYDLFTTGISTTTFNPQHTRLSATSFKIELDYTSPIEAVTRTVPSSVQSLQYIKLQNRSDGAFVDSTDINGKLDDLKFYDNVTSV